MCPAPIKPWAETPRACVLRVGEGLLCVVLRGGRDSQDPAVHPGCVALINLGCEPVHPAAVLGPRHRWAVLGVEAVDTGRAFSKPEGGLTAACLRPAVPLAEVPHPDAPTLGSEPLAPPRCGPDIPAGEAALPQLCGRGLQSSPRKPSAARDERAQRGRRLEAPPSMSLCLPESRPVTIPGEEESPRRNPELGVTLRLEKKKAGGGGLWGSSKPLSGPAVPGWPYLQRDLVDINKLHWSPESPVHLQCRPESSLHLRSEGGRVLPLESGERRGKRRP